MITKAYCRAQLGPFLQSSPGFQFIDNPGYNQDRGPAWVAIVRLRPAYEGEVLPGKFGGAI